MLPYPHTDPLPGQKFSWLKNFDTTSVRSLAVFKLCRHRKSCFKIKTETLEANTIREKFHEFIPGKLLNNQKQEQSLGSPDSRVATICYLKCLVVNKKNYETCRETGTIHSKGKSSKQKLGLQTMDLINSIQYSYYKYGQRTKVNHV